MKITAAVAALILLLSACTGLPPQATPTVTLSADDLDQVALAAPCRDVHDYRNQATREELARFAAVAVVSCRYWHRVYPDDGDWWILTRNVAAGNLSDLLSALRRADDDPPMDDLCGNLEAPSGLLLTDGVHYLHPRTPKDGCGRTQPAVDDALAAMDWRTVSVTRIKQIATQAAVERSCSRTWRNEFSLVSSPLQAGGEAPALSDEHGLPREICIYGPGRNPEVGQFTRIVTLYDDDATALDLALSGRRPEATCPSQRRFAVVRSAENLGFESVTVELGGCWRVLRLDIGVDVAATANAASLRRLLQLN